VLERGAARVCRPRATVLAVTLVVGQSVAPLWAEPRRQADAATGFLELLDKKQLSVAAHSWLSPARTEWSYFPWGHTGLALSDLSQEQKQAALTLLETGLSEDGRHKAHQVIELEEDQVGNGFLSNLWEDPEAYHTAVFGVPTPSSLWSWRFEGHHLSVNLSLANGKVVSGTPYFIGADPAHVQNGPLAGMAILRKEEDSARALFLSLDKAQREKALIKEKAPKDIVTGNESVAILPCCEGLMMTELDEGQQQELLALVSLVMNQLEATAAGIHRLRMERAGTAKLSFAWAGAAEPGEPHYFRIQGPTMLIEYDNTEDNANHVHLVLRDPEMDFGGNPLRAHYTSNHRAQAASP